ncbi:MAG: nicotinate-nucleotide adenylyltransferase [Rhodospirillales bacterium]
MSSRATPLATPARLGAALGGRLPPPGRAIGLLGGSFNPAHAGHLHISREALKRLNLSEVWWLVSPQNPLKSARGMAPLVQRLHSARQVARDPRITVTALESLLGSRYTAESLRRLRKRLPGRSFVWLMGADNMIQIDRWHDWASIFEQLPVAVLARPSYSIKASSSKAAQRFGKMRLTAARSRGLARQPPPAWALLRIRLSKLSATKLRQAQGG